MTMSALCTFICGPRLRNALNLTALTGRVAVGDRVLLNTVAVEMKLGTGGLDFVVARPGRQETLVDSSTADHVRVWINGRMAVESIATDSAFAPGRAAMFDRFLAYQAHLHPTARRSQLGRYSPRRPWHTARSPLARCPTWLPHWGRPNRPHSLR